MTRIDEKQLEPSMIQYERYRMERQRQHWCAEYRSPPRQLDKLDKFKQLSDGRLVCTEMVNHHIELTTLDIQPTDSAPYCSGPKTRKLERMGTGKMLHKHVIGPAQL